MVYFISQGSRTVSSLTIPPNECKVVTPQGLFGEEGCLFIEATKVVIPSMVIPSEGHAFLFPPPCWRFFRTGTFLLSEICLVWSLLTLFSHCIAAHHITAEPRSRDTTSTGGRLPSHPAFQLHLACDQ